MHKARRARNGYLEAISIPKIMSLEPTRSPTQRAPQFSCEGRERSTKRQRQTDRFWEEGELMGVVMGVVMGVAMREWWRNGKNQNAVVF
jgi:hypothetical protein